MEYIYTINWTPKRVVETLDSINGFMSNMGFREGKLVSSAPVGTLKIKSPAEIPNDLLEKFLIEATKEYEKVLKR